MGQGWEYTPLWFVQQEEQWFRAAVHILAQSMGGNSLYQRSSAEN